VAIGLEVKDIGNLIREAGTPQELPRGSEERGEIRELVHKAIEGLWPPFSLTNHARSSSGAGFLLQTLQVS
jgi:hypothetical protein